MRKDQKRVSENQRVSSGVIYCVGVPIGNITDISSHAQTILEKADIIAAEDTRSFQQLAKDLKISYKQILSYHDHSERDSSEELIQMVISGKNLALVSDAGTPQISDPGYHLIKKAYENNIIVKPIPGPSSLTAALSVCPIGGKSFYFGGFAPINSKDLQNELNKIGPLSDRIAYFESPHRILDHLDVAIETYGDTKIFIAREMTKTYEEYLFASPQKLKTLLANPKGEFVVIYPRMQDTEISLDELKKQIQEFVSENLKPSDILSKIRHTTRLSRRELYDLITEIKHGLKK